MDGVVLTPLKQVFHPKGNILHALKSSDVGYNGFGEAYFSSINSGDVKGWKQHTQMTMNLVVPIGEICFVIHDKEEGSYFSVTLSKTNYQRLTIHPGLWVAFKGIGKHKNLLLNMADMEHDPNESINMHLDSIYYEW